MNFGEIIFLFIIIVTMGGALMAVLSGSIVYALMGLVTAQNGAWVTQEGESLDPAGNPSHRGG